MSRISLTAIAAAVLMPITLSAQMAPSRVDSTGQPRMGAVAVQDGSSGRSTTSKFFVGLALNGVSVDSDDLLDDTETGYGVSLHLGYGFTPLFSLFVEGAAASVDVDGEEFGLVHADIGARLHFGSSASAFRPFVDLAFSARAAGQDDVTFDDDGTPVTGDLEISGSGFTVGGGFLYFFNPKWAFNANLKWTKGEFDTVKFENVSISGLEIDATTMRLGFGISWFPQR